MNAKVPKLTKTNKQQQQQQQQQKPSQTCPYDLKTVKEALLTC